MAPPFPVLFEDNHLLAIVKPPGIATMGVSAGRRSVLDLARQYIKIKFNKPGNVYLGVVSRLDSPVSGVLLLARTSKAAARLSEQFRAQAVEKTYWAVVEGRIQPPAGEWIDWLEHDEDNRRMATVPRATRRAKEARLEYRTLSTVAPVSSAPGRSGLVSSAPGRSGLALIQVALRTGRKHQIRVQLAHRGHAIVGDRKYGSRVAFSAGIALHARRLVLDHPVRRVRLDLVAPLPRAWRKLELAD
jgi:23S rRNA pseudouridine1911/1915/1917 synthase